MITTIAGDITATLSFSQFTGRVNFDESRSLLTLDLADGTSEVMSTSLAGYNLEPREGAVFIKGWSEHTGLAASLEAAGVVEIIRALNVGPFHSRAYEVRVCAPRAAAIAA